jgi:2-aminoadipate transaminase
MTVDNPIRSLYSKMAMQGQRGYPEPPENPIKWSFDAGLPDPSTFPADDLIRLSGSALRLDQAGALQYGAGADNELLYGYAGLRDALAQRARELFGSDVDVRRVMLTSGGVQAISLALQAFLNPGDVVAVEAPTWNMVVGRVAQLDLQAVAIPMDQDGLRLDVLEEQLDTLRSRGTPLKLLYTIATFNSPTGTCLSESRRRRLVDLAAEWQFIILEDDVYGDLRYGGERLPDLFSMDEAGMVLKIGTFSKIIAPGLRLGWLMGQPDALDAVASVRGDLGVSQWTARILAAYMTEGLLEPHIGRVNDLYRRKRDVAAAMLEKYCAPWVTFRVPDGGFNHWVELAEGIDATTVRELALRHGVDCRAGGRFFGEPGAGGRYVRIAYSQVPLDEIERGLAVFGEAIRASAGASRPTSVGR